MKKYVLLLLLLKTTLAFAGVEALPWPTNVLNAYLKQPSAKFVVVQRSAPESLIIFDQKAGQSARLERTKSPTQFLVNRKLIDLEKFQSRKELRDAIQNRLKKISSITFAMMAVAEADEADVDKLNVNLTTAIDALIAATATSETCAPFFEFGKKCNDYADQMKALQSRNYSRGTSASDPNDQLAFEAKQLSIHQSLETQIQSLHAKALDIFIMHVSFARTCTCSQDGFATQACQEGHEMSSPAVAETILCKTKIENLLQIDDSMKPMVEALQDVLGLRKMPVSSKTAPLKPATQPATW